MKNAFNLVFDRQDFALQYQCVMSSYSDFLKSRAQDAVTTMERVLAGEELTENSLVNVPIAGEDGEQKQIVFKATDIYRCVEELDTNNMVTSVSGESYGIEDIFGAVTDFVNTHRADATILDAYSVEARTNGLSATISKSDVIASLESQGISVADITHSSILNAALEGAPMYSVLESLITTVDEGSHLANAEVPDILNITRDLSGNGENLWMAAFEDIFDDISNLANAVQEFCQTGVDMLNQVVSYLIGIVATFFGSSVTALSTDYVVNEKGDYGFDAPWFIYSVDTEATDVLDRSFRYTYQKGLLNSQGTAMSVDLRAIRNHVSGDRFVTGLSSVGIYVIFHPSGSSPGTIAVAVYPTLLGVSRTYGYGVIGSFEDDGSIAFENAYAYSQVHASPLADVFNAVLNSSDEERDVAVGNYFKACREYLSNFTTTYASGLYAPVGVVDGYTLANHFFYMLYGNGVLNAKLDYANPSFTANDWSEYLSEVMQPKSSAYAVRVLRVFQAIIAHYLVGYEFGHFTANATNFTAVSDIEVIFNYSGLIRANPSSNPSDENFQGLMRCKLQTGPSSALNASSYTMASWPGANDISSGEPLRLFRERVVPAMEAVTPCWFPYSTRESWAPTRVHVQTYAERVQEVKSVILGAVTAAGLVVGAVVARKVSRKIKGKQLQARNSKIIAERAYLASPSPEGLKAYCKAEKKSRLWDSLAKCSGVSKKPFSLDLGTEQTISAVLQAITG